MFRLFVAFRLIFWAVQVTKVENHPCEEWLTLETSAFNLFTVAQFSLSTQLINSHTPDFQQDNYFR